MIFLLIYTMLSSALFGGIEQYFKHNPHDNVPHQMRNIDFIYMINLDKRPEKYAKSCEQLKPYGIVPFRFSAVNAYEDLNPQIVNDVGVKFTSSMRGGFMGTSYLETDSDYWLHPHHETIHLPGRTYFCHCMAVAPIAICLSHLSVLQDAWDHGYETIWVMEDDIEVVKDPRILSDKIEYLNKLLKGSWDILFTDPNTRTNDGKRHPCSGFPKRPNYICNKSSGSIHLGYDLQTIATRAGAYSMIVRRSGIKKLLEYFKTYNLFLPYDMEYTMPASLVAVRATDDIVTTMLNAPSDNGAPNYKN